MLERFQLAFDRTLEHLTRVPIQVIAQQEPRAVADVLDGVREVVHESSGNPPEHRLALLPLDVLLQLDQLIGHRVERLAEIEEFVVGEDLHASLELTGRQRMCAALQREDRRDELASKQIPDRDHRQQDDRDRDDELPL